MLKHLRKKETPAKTKYSDYLLDYRGGYYDAGDSAEIQRAKQSREENTAIPFILEDYF